MLRGAEAARTPARTAIRASAGLVHGQRPRRLDRGRGPAVLVFDRTERSRRPPGSSSSRSSCPRCSRPGLTAHLDQLPLRRTLPALYVIEALVFAALAFLADDGRFVLALVLVLGLVDGTLAITGRGLTRGAVAVVLQPRGLIAEGNALMNLGFAAVVGVRRRARRRPDRGLRAVGRAAGRRRVVPGHRDRGWPSPRTCPGSSTRTASRGTRASATGWRSRATTGSCARCWSGSRWR